MEDRSAWGPAPGPWRRALAWVLTAVVLFGGAALSVTATVMVAQGERRFAAETMDRYADDAGAAFTHEVEDYQHTLADLATALGAEPALSADAFATLADGLDRDRLPAAAGVALVVAAADADVAALQADWQSRGAAGLQLNPAGPGGEHEFVVLDRSFDGSASVAGRDLSEAAEPAAALRTARQTAAFAVSGSYVLLRDRSLPADRQQRGVMLAQPVFARTASGADIRQFRGWVVAGVRAGDLLTDTLRAESHNGVQLTLTEDDGGRRQVLASVSTGDLRPASTDLHRDEVLEVGQRAWVLTVAPTTRLLSAADRRMTQLTLIAGLIITILLAVVVGLLTGARDRAMTQVATATVALREDIDRRKTVEAQLRHRETELSHLALHDPLTGLANRALLIERVGHAFQTHERDERTFAVLYIDLDGFKPVNDRHGHNAGDVVLCEVAERIRRCVRTGDTVARVGGDEFAVLLERLTGRATAATTAHRILQAVDAPIGVPAMPPAVAPEVVQVTASIGVGFSGDAPDTDTLLRLADTAMYQAKTGGKGRLTLSSPEEL